MKRIAMGLVLAFAASFASAPPSAAAPAMQLWRLDCGSILIKEFNSFFSDTLEYKSGPRTVASSCYLVRHGEQYLLWDTGYPASFRGKSEAGSLTVASLRVTVAEQLRALKLTPADIDVIGISHMHGDHTGQAREFSAAKLVVGKADFELTKGDKDPFGPWRSEGAKLQLMHGADIDLFGDGRVVALNLPGHTPDHMALLVRLASGNILLTGDLYHATEARALRGVPPFNTSRAETLASIDRFERLAKVWKAKVIIQHEPADIAKLPAFPMAAK